MPKILVIDPTLGSAVSFYRSVGPLSYLHRIDPHITYESVSNFNSWTWIGPDILYIQRPYALDHIQAIEEAKKCNVKVWVDTDDLIEDIPKYNPNHKSFTNKLIDNYKHAIKEADIVTVTTEKLKEQYSGYNDNVRIIENAHNDYLFNFEKFIGDSRQSICWRGSTTHRMDLLSVAEQIINLNNKYRDWQWVFLGNDLWYITDLMKGKVVEISEKTITKYFEILRTIGSAVMMFPLIDNNFNKAKSSISWLEATYGGMVCVAPDLPEFNKPGCLKYKDAQQFAYYMEKCIKSKSFREENYEKSYNYIKENLLLSKINQKRINVIKELVG